MNKPENNNSTHWTLWKTQRVYL